MIPKKIHYCWFGQGKMSKQATDCLESWRKQLPDYEVIIWNEENFDININQFVSEAYKGKKFAFVTDYVRLYALYHHGGIYMDTDVELLKPLDKFMNHRVFLGFEKGNLLQTGLIAAEKGHPWIKMLLDHYKNKTYIKEDGSVDPTPNTVVVTEITKENYKWTPKNKHQVLEGGINIYPIKFFCAKDWRTGKVTVNKYTYAVHHFAGSWVDEKVTTPHENKGLKAIIVKLFGYDVLQWLVKVKRILKNK